MVTIASANDGTRTRWSKSELRKPGSSSLDAHRSILQQQLQGGVSILVVLGQLSRPPDLLCIRDPHPSGLMNTERTGNTKVKLGSGFRVGVGLQWSGEQPGPRTAEVTPNHQQRVETKTGA